MNRIDVLFSLTILPVILFGQATTGGGSYDDDPRADPLDWQDNASWTSATYPGSGTDGDSTLNLDGENLNLNHYTILGSNTSTVNIEVATSNNAGTFSIGDVTIIYGNVSFGNKANPLLYEKFFVLF